MSKRKKHARALTEDGAGQPCVRCGHVTQRCTHPAITERHLRRPFYYAYWYRCINGACITSLIMPKEARVFRDEKTRHQFTSREQSYERNNTNHT